MNNKMNSILAVLSLGTLLALAAAGCATTSPYAAAPMKQETTGEPVGERLREAQMEGYQLTYYLLDAGDAVSPKTKHLMVFVTASDGKEVPEAEVTYKVTGPGLEDRTITTYRPKGGTFTYKLGPEQHKAKAVSMAGGYGADVQVRAKGEYKIAAKVTVGTKNLTDEFGYTVK